MAEVYEDITGSSTDDVVFALDGHKKRIKLNFSVSKNEKERSALSIYM
jgi:hypothetical protein